MTINYQIYFDSAKNPATRKRQKKQQNEPKNVRSNSSKIAFRRGTSDRKFQFSGLFQRPVLNCLDVHLYDMYVINPLTETSLKCTARSTEIGCDSINFAS